jgi:hypothetical protein
MTLPNSRRISHNGTTITPDLEDMLLSNFKRPSHDGITLTSDVEEITLSNYLKAIQAIYCGNNVSLPKDELSS